MSRAAPETPPYDPPADALARAALLPEGFYDVLPPDAAHEARVVEVMMAVLARQGYDAKYGARPLRRVIQRTVEDDLSEELIAGRIALGDQVRLRADGEKIVVEKAA